MEQDDRHDLSRFNDVGAIALTSQGISCVLAIGSPGGYTMTHVMFSLSTGLEDNSVVQHKTPRVHVGR